VIGMSSLREFRCKALSDSNYRAGDRTSKDLFALRFSHRGAIVRRPDIRLQFTETLVLGTLNRDTLSLAREVLRVEAEALAQVAGRLDADFERVVEMLAEASGRVAVSGVGKSADIGRKIVATFNSTGSRAYFLDPAAALHGDLGTIHPGDIALLLSHSGESDEIIRLIDPLRELTAGIAALTGNRRGTLARRADVAFAYGLIREADPLALAPSSSTTVMLALGDALAFTLAEIRGFTADDFARFHPAGSLGVKLARVEAFMRRGGAMRTAQEHELVRDVFGRPSPAGRRTGAVMILDADGRLSGLFTDSDLARLFSKRLDAVNRPIGEVMTQSPLTVAAGLRLADALEIFKLHKISELPVLDAEGRPVGLLDITDLIHLLPGDGEDAARAA
jgi:arabinose-5-phosphate isomerase